jgi:hypothetical protein
VTIIATIAHRMNPPTVEVYRHIRSISQGFDGIELTRSADHSEILLIDVVKLEVVLCES